MNEIDIKLKELELRLDKFEEKVNKINDLILKTIDLKIEISNYEDGIEECRKTFNENKFLQLTKNMIKELDEKKERYKTNLDELQRLAKG